MTRLVRLTLLAEREGNSVRLSGGKTCLQKEISSVTVSGSQKERCPGVSSFLASEEKVKEELRHSRPDPGGMSCRGELSASRI